MPTRIYFEFSIIVPMVCSSLWCSEYRTNFEISLISSDLSETSLNCSIIHVYVGGSGMCTDDI